MAVLPTATESPLLYACELWVFAMCPALRGSTVSYAGDAHFPKHSLEYSLNFWSQSKKKMKQMPRYGGVLPVRTYRICLGRNVKHYLKNGENLTKLSKLWSA